MRDWYRQHYLDLLGSIYIYNEHRGYTAIDRVLSAIELDGLGSGIYSRRIEKHRSDERKHYLMFRRWFERRGRCRWQSTGLADISIALSTLCSESRSTAREPSWLPTTCSSDVPRGVVDRTARVSSGGNFVRSTRSSSAIRTLMKIFRIIREDEPQAIGQPYDRWIAMLMADRQAEMVELCAIRSSIPSFCS